MLISTNKFITPPSNSVTSDLNSRGLPLLQAHNYCVSYCLRACSLLDMSVALWDLDDIFSANQISVSHLLLSKF